MTTKTVPFIVEDGFNTSYIDALFVSMFYKPSYMQNILSEYIEDTNFLHLQDMIYDYFVHNMRMNYTISAELMNEIRNYLVYCGWKNNSNFIELFEVQELYDFIINKYNKKITFDRYKDNLSMNYISLDVNKTTDIRTLLNDWTEKELVNYELKDIPNFIPIYLNRNTQDKNNNIFLVDIKEAIRFKTSKKEGQQNCVWKIQSIVCYSKTDVGRYYSVVVDDRGWYMYSNSALPSLVNINIKDEDIALKIQKECVFLFYSLFSIVEKN